MNAAYLVNGLPGWTSMLLALRDEHAKAEMGRCVAQRPDDRERLLAPQPGA
jgi:hypothetical protein